MKKLLILAILSCGVVFGVDAHESAQDSTHKDYIVKCDKCVIDVGFTDADIEAMKKKYGEDDFYVVADDANYYSYNLSKYLEQHNIEYVSVGRLERAFETLIFPNDKIIIKKDDIYDYYLYEKNKKPVKLKDSVDFVPEINAYFGIVKKETK